MKSDSSVFVKVVFAVKSYCLNKNKGANKGKCQMIGVSVVLVKRRHV